MIVILVVIISEDRNYVRKKSVNLTWITHSIRTHTATVESQLNMLVRCIQRFRLISFAQKHTAHTAIVELNSVVSWYYVYIRGIRRRNITTKTTKWREWTNEVKKQRQADDISVCANKNYISGVRAASCECVRETIIIDSRESKRTHSPISSATVTAHSRRDFIRFLHTNAHTLTHTLTPKTEHRSKNGMFMFFNHSLFVADANYCVCVCKCMNSNQELINSHFIRLSLSHSCAVQWPVVRRARSNDGVSMCAIAQKMGVSKIDVCLT